MAVIIVALLYILGGTLFSSNTLRYLLKILLYCTIGSMWNLLSGFTGMTSLGQQSFIGVSGYALCVITATYGLSYGLGLFVGAVVGGVLSLGLAIILFRMRGMYFAVATWVIAEALRVFFTSWTYVNQGGGMTVAARTIPNYTDNIFHRINSMCGCFSCYLCST